MPSLSEITYTIQNNCLMSIITDLKVTGIHYDIKPHPFHPYSRSVLDQFFLMTLITGVAVTVVALSICIPAIWWELCVLADVIQCTIWHVWICVRFCISITASLIKCGLTPVVYGACYTVHSSHEENKENLFCHYGKTWCSYEAVMSFSATHSKAVTTNKAKSKVGGK